MQSLASCLKQHSASLARCLPGLLAAAAVKLHATAGQLLQGCFSTSEGQAGLVQTVLEGLHAALQQSDCDDGLLRGCVATRLALMLHQQEQLDAAISVVQQVRCCEVGLARKQHGGMHAEIHTHVSGVLFLANDHRCLTFTNHGHKGVETEGTATWAALPACF
jgi:hypothetical protein